MSISLPELNIIDLLELSNKLMTTQIHLLYCVLLMYNYVW